MIAFTTVTSSKCSW